MSSILDSIETAGRASHLKDVRSRPQKLHFIKAFFLSAIISPFILAKLLFVPIFGHFIVFLNIILLYYYLKIKGSTKYTLTVLSGAATSLVLLSILFGNYPRSFDLMLGSYMLLASSVGLLLMVSLGMAIYRNTFPD